MCFLFLRHAEAVDFSDSDFSRVLTPKGWKQAEQIGHFCKENDLLPSIILSSPVVRARQTAEKFREITKAGEVRFEEDLACGASPEAFLRLLKMNAEGGMILFVGHEPDLGLAISRFIGLDNSGGLRIRKATLALLEARTARFGGAELQLLIHPAILPKY